MALKDAERKALDMTLLRELTADELREELERLREERFRLRFRSATEAIENPNQFKMLRRNIARITTVLQERTHA